MRFPSSESSTTASLSLQKCFNRREWLSVSHNTDKMTETQKIRLKVKQNIKFISKCFLKIQYLYQNK